MKLLSSILLASASVMAVQRPEDGSTVDLDAIKAIKSMTWRTPMTRWNQAHPTKSNTQKKRLPRMEFIMSLLFTQRNPRSNTVLPQTPLWTPHMITFHQHHHHMIPKTITIVNAKIQNAVVMLKKWHAGRWRWVNGNTTKTVSFLIINQYGTGSTITTLGYQNTGYKCGSYKCSYHIM